jgi:hypothetical protein
LTGSITDTPQVSDTIHKLPLDILIIGIVVCLLFNKRRGIYKRCLAQRVFQLPRFAEADVDFADFGCRCFLMTGGESKK